MPHVCARLPAELVAEIRRRWLADEPIKVICDELKVGPGVLGKYVADLPWRGHHEALRQKILSLAAEGKDIGAISAQLGCPIRTVSRALRPPPLTPEQDEARRAELAAGRALRRKERDVEKHAAEVAGRHADRQAKVDLARARYREGVHVKDIANEIGRSPGFVCFAVRDLPRRQPRAPKVTPTAPAEAPAPPGAA